MSKLSAADQSKQDAARETDGKFGNQLHGEAPGGTGVLVSGTDPIDTPEEAFIPQDRKQHTAMVMAIEEMPDHIRSFRLQLGEDGTLCVEDVKDAEGRTVSEHVAAEIEDIFFDVEEGEFSEYIGKTVDVGETLVIWQQK